MTKEDIIEVIEVINKQLEENKKVVNDYAGRSDIDILTICTLSQMLLTSKQMWKETLLCEYGVYYMG